MVPFESKDLPRPIRIGLTGALRSLSAEFFPLRHRWDGGRMSWWSFGSWKGGRFCLVIGYITIEHGPFRSLIYPA